LRKSFWAGLDRLLPKGDVRPRERKTQRAPAGAPNPSLPLALKRWLGFMLLGGTMALAGLLALWRAVASVFGL
jgi:hypothetical protein